MQSEEIIALTGLGACTVIVPDICAVTPILPKFDIVDMAAGSRFEDEDQLMLRTVKRTHARIALHPDRDVLELRIDVPAGCKQLVYMTPIHANKVNGAISAVLCEQSADLGQELNETLPRKFADPLRKLAMTSLSLAGNMPFDRNIVGWVDEHHISALLLHKSVEGHVRGSVSAINPMVTELPDLAHLTNWQTSGRVDFIVVVLAPFAFIKVLQAQVNFRQSETRNRKVELDIQLLQFKEILTKQPLIPMRVLCQPIICDPQRLQLRRRQVPDLNHWNARHAKLLRRQDAPMSDNDMTFTVDDHGH